MSSIDVRLPIHQHAFELYDKYQLFFNMDEKSKFFSILNPEEEELVGELMIKNITGRTSALLWLDQLSEEERLVLDLVYNNKLSQPGLYGKLNRRNSNKRNSKKRNSKKRNSKKRNSKKAKLKQAKLK